MFVYFTLVHHYVDMLFPRVPRGARAAVLCAIAIASVLAAGMLAAGEAGALAPGAAQAGGTRASGVNTPLAIAGFAVLSTGLLVIGRSRGGQRRAAGGPALLPAVPLAAPATTAAPRPVAADLAALAPLAAVAGALHATAEALASIAPDLPAPASGTVAASAERVREAHVTIARWLETRR